MNPNPPLTPPEDGQPPVAPPPMAPVQDATPVPPAPVDTGVPQPVPEPAPQPQPFAPQDQPLAAPSPMEPALQPAPQQPTPQVFGSGPATPAPAPAAPQGSKKKIALLAGIIGGVVVLAGVGAALFFMLTAVSKADYAAAATQLNVVTNEVTSLQANVQTFSGSTDNFEEVYNDLKDGIATVRTENDALKQLKAMRVGEGQKLYQAFDEKLSTYLTYAENYAKSVNEVMPAMKQCEDSVDFSNTQVAAKSIRECADAFAAVGDVSDAAVREYKESNAATFKKFAELYESIAAITDPFGAERTKYRQLLDQMTGITKEMREVGDTIKKATKDKEAELSPNDAHKVLAEYLTNQQK